MAIRASELLDQAATRYDNPKMWNQSWNYRFKNSLIANWVSTNTFKIDVMDHKADLMWTFSREKIKKSSGSFYWFFVVGIDKVIFNTSIFQTFERASYILMAIEIIFKVDSVTENCQNAEVVNESTIYWMEKYEKC